MSITIKTGSPVTGEDFFGRKQELKNAHRYLNDRNSLLLSAPRRIGKSSLAKRLREDMAAKGWKSLYIDLQGIATMEAFLRSLIEALKDENVLSKGNVKAFINDIFDKVEGINLLGKIKIDLKSRDMVESLFQRLESLLDHSQDTLIIIDELPLFLGKLMENNSGNRENVESMLSWLRKIRGVDNTAIRWIFCGSVGLRNFTNHYGMSHTINDLTDLEIGPLSEDEAKGLLKALTTAYNLKMKDELISETLELLQWSIPYFIQLLVDRLIINLSDMEEKEVMVADVEKAIKELSHSDKFMTWDERLKEYRELKLMARAVLDNLAVTVNGLSRSQLHTIVMERHDPNDAQTVEQDLTKVLEMLIHDGYIMREKDIRKFRSPLLREWWKYKFID